MPGIEHRAINQRLDRRVEIGIGADIAGILSPQFSADACEGARRRTFDRAATRNRPGKVDMVEGSFRNQACGCLVIEKEVLEHIIRDPGSVKGFCHAFADQQGLRGMLEKDHIPRNQGRRHRVDRCHVRIVPGRDHEDDPLRFAHDLAPESRTVLDQDRGKCFRRNCSHMARAFLEPAEFTAIADRSSHLMRQFECHALGGLANLGHPREDQRNAFL